MKTFNNKTGFDDAEKKHESARSYSNHRSSIRHHYNGINSKGYRGTFIRSYKPPNHTNFNLSREKSVKCNELNIPRLMSVNVQKSTLRSAKESGPWSEEALELERKQQLLNTANKLLNKLKMWNTGKNDVKGSEVSSNEGAKKGAPESSNKKEKGKVKQIQQTQNKVGNVNEKQEEKTQKRSHFDTKKKTFSFQKIQLKNKSQGSSEYKQKKIHQNIIGELMTMPKENLNKVLMNPKIHPKIERKMAQIVKENRLILAQKFRHLAESKINSQGQSQFQSKFVNDVENLIDPDFAIDLCQLPPELIKKMGDIFQLDFDSCLTSTVVEENGNLNRLPCNDFHDKTEDFGDCCRNNSVSIPENSAENYLETVYVKAENHADVCDIEMEESKIGKISVRDFASCCNDIPLIMDHSSEADYTEKNKNEFPVVGDKSSFKISEGNLSEKRKEPMEKIENEFVNPSCTRLVSKKLRRDSSTNVNSGTNCTRTPQYDDHFTETMSQQVIKQKADNVWRPLDETQIIQNIIETKASLIVEEGRSNDYIKNEKLEKKSCGIQTVIHLIEKDHSSLCEPNFPENLGETEKETTIKEIDMIDQLIHELNQRRFFLFLRLLNLKTCSASNKLKKRLLNAVTNNEHSLKRKPKKIHDRNPNSTQTIFLHQTKKKTDGSEGNTTGNVEQGPLVEKKVDRDVIMTDCISSLRKDNVYKGSF